MSQMGRSFTNSGGGGFVQTINGATPLAGNINLTSTGATIIITPGANTVNLETSGASANSFVTNAGAATPVLGVLNILGGSNIATTGAGNTVTINVSGTTNHTVQLGNAGGSLTSLANGTTGQVLHAVTGANNPIWSAVSLTADVAGILPIANGGTNANAFGTVDGTVYYDGTRLATTATGTANFVLTSNGAGVAPTYQTVSASGAVTSVTGGTNITITGTATAPIVSSSADQYLTSYRVANASPFVVNATDFYITVDTSTIPITIQLPNAPTIYRRFVIKDSAGNAATQNITVTTVGGVLNIDAAATFVMNTNWQSIQVVFDAFGYQVF